MCPAFGIMTTFPTKRWLRRNGTSRVPYDNIASPERDEPRSLQQHCIAGTNVSPQRITKMDMGFSKTVCCHPKGMIVILNEVTHSVLRKDLTH